jgi:hypothetical protein
MRDYFDYVQTAAMTVAMNSAWLAVAPPTGEDEAKLADLRELLASAILEVASRGVRDPKKISTLALRSMLSVTPRNRSFLR